MTRARELADLLTGGQTITTADNNPQLTLESTDADANFGPVLKMHRNSGSPADSDFLGELQLKGENDAGEEILYAQMFGRTGDVSDGTEDGRIATKIMIAGTAQNVLDIKSDEIVINDDSVDLDFRVESNGNANMLFVDGGNDLVGIGTTPASGVKLQVKTATDRHLAAFDNSAGPTLGAVTDAAASTTLRLAGSPLVMTGGGGSGAEHARVDSSGRLLVGATTTGASSTQKFEVNGGMSFLKFDHDSASPLITRNDNSVSGDGVPHIVFQNSSGNRGGIFRNSSNEIGLHGQGAVTFHTGGTAPTTERMRIQSAGQIFVGKSAENLQSDGIEMHPGAHLSSTASASVAGIFNRKTNDGTVVQIRQDNTTEGSITVSGTTVTYGGGHLARWSRLSDNSKDTSIVKGTVMTNLDQMVVWHCEAQPATYYEEGDELPEGISVGDEKTPAVAAYDEDNEQLNCTAVSSVEGDANVAGVFVSWDDEDDYNDFFVGMTGDMVIRIAQGTTVARGDLLMSAGDGTAKPQGDDIVRSKTIAKVTSTTKSHTYDDGSYLVPCVLMAC